MALTFPYSKITFFNVHYSKRAILKAWHPSGSKSSHNNSPHWAQLQRSAAFSGTACPKVILSLCF